MPVLLFLSWPVHPLIATENLPVISTSTTDYCNADTDISKSLGVRNIPGLK